jgi:hypothetical protein
MATMTDTAARTAHLLALMRKGGEAFNARDFALVDTVLALRQPATTARSSRRVSNEPQQREQQQRHASAVTLFDRVRNIFVHHAPHPWDTPPAAQERNEPGQHPEPRRAAPRRLGCARHTTAILSTRGPVVGLLWCAAAMA